jgi:glucan endo-1,3-alpha-glucosidase
MGSVRLRYASHSIFQSYMYGQCLALNIAANDYEVDRIVDAYAAAEALDFKLFYSFDMSYTWQQSDIVNIVANHSSSPSTFLWKNTILVSTYSGESYGEDFWASFKSALQSKGIDITLAPAFTTYRDPSSADSLVSTFPSIDGFFNWWSW